MHRLILIGLASLAFAAPKHTNKPDNLPSPPLPGGAEKKSPLDTPRPISDEPPKAKSQGDGDPSSESGGEPCDLKHPVETFVQISSSHSPQIGADKTGFFLSDLRDTPQVFQIFTKQTWPKQITFFPDGVSSHKMSPDGEKLLITTQSGGNEQYQVHLYEPKKSSAVIPLVTDSGARVESIAWSPNSEWFAYTSNKRNKTDMDLYKFTLATKKSELLTELSGHNSVTDISPDQKLVAITRFVSITESYIHIYKMADSKVAKVTDPEPVGVHEGAHFSGDSKHFLAIAYNDKGFRQLVLYTIEGARKKTFTANNEIDGFNLHPKRDLIIYSVNTDGYSTLNFHEVESSGNLGRRLSVPSLGTSVVSGTAFSRTKRAGFFLSYSNSSQSNDIWEWQPSKLTQWTNSTHGQISPECFSRAELVKYPSFDGKEIPAFIFQPKGKKGPIPFVLYAHGGPESQYKPSFNRIFQYLLERGFGVFAPNVRGSSGYGRDYTKLDDYKKRMDSVKDFVAAAEWLIEKRYTSAAQLGIYGGSYGGFVVLRTIEEAPHLFAAASESVGIANFVTFLKNTSSYRRALREVEYGPLTDEAFLLSVSPITYMDKIKTPLLIFHGANDPRVPVSETEQMVKALKEKGTPVEFKIFSDEGHGTVKTHNLLEQARQTTYFFEKYMK